MKYEDPPQLPREVAAAALEEVLQGGVPEHEPHAALLGLALFDEDREHAEGWAVRIGQRAPDPRLRDSAALAIGHLARRFGVVGPEARSLVSEIAAHPDSDGRALDALDDLRLFAPD